MNRKGDVSMVGIVIGILLALLVLVVGYQLLKTYVLGPGTTNPPGWDEATAATAPLVVLLRRKKTTTFK